jgi:glucuronate isomerase
MPADNLNLIQRLNAELAKIPLVDSHSHVPGPDPVSRTLDDILGYHYYTELAHSTGMSKDCLAKDHDPAARCREILSYLRKLKNTAQYSWFTHICRDFLGFQGGHPNETHAEQLWHEARTVFSRPDWEQTVWKKTNLACVFLTNDFDDALEGFDTTRYIPCLRTDDLVFHLHDPAVRNRLEKATAIAPTNAAKTRQAIDKLFAHFKAKGARACAISLPPSFTPAPVSDAAIDRALQNPTPGSTELAQGIFWILAEHCRDHHLPFDLMIGVNRKVYAAGVFQGQDLFDRRTSLLQYAALFNAFPSVMFPVSVLDGAQNQELASHAWIFPNVIAHGHWWYANVPSIIERDLRDRLNAVPAVKLIGYYSDAYKLEFILPKCSMFRGLLSRILANDFVAPGTLTEEEAVGVAGQLLEGNSRRIFRLPATGPGPA